MNNNTNQTEDAFFPIQNFSPELNEVIVRCSNNYYLFQQGKIIKLTTGNIDLTKSNDPIDLTGSTIINEIVQHECH